MKQYRTSITGCILAASLLLLAACASLPFERVDYKAYPTAENASDFFGRVYARTRLEEIKGQEVPSAAEASQLVGFPVRLPSYVPEGLEAIDKIDTSQPHTYRVEVDLNQALALLQAAGIHSDNLPTVLDGFQVDAVIPPGTLTYQGSDERFVTFMQSTNPSYVVPPGVEPAILEELGRLGWQYLGLTSEQAHQLSQRMKWASFLTLPPADMDSAQSVMIKDVQGVVLQTSDPEILHRALLWEDDGILYGLYSNLPDEELLKIAESLR